MPKEGTKERCPLWAVRHGRLNLRSLSAGQGMGDAHTGHTHAQDASYCQARAHKVKPQGSKPSTQAKDDSPAQAILWTAEETKKESGRRTGKRRRDGKGTERSAEAWRAKFFRSSAALNRDTV